MRVSERPSINELRALLAKRAQQVPPAFYVRHKAPRRKTGNDERLAAIMKSLENES